MRVCGSQFPRCLVFNLLPNPLVLFLTVYSGQFHSVKGEGDELVLVSKCNFHFRAFIQSSSLAHSVAILSHTFPRLCHLHLFFHLV